MRYWVALVFWMLVIFIGSSFPGERIPGKVSHISVVFHTIEYLLLYIFSVAAFSRAQRTQWNRSPEIIALLFCIIYSVSDEIHQIFVPGRNADIWDIITDGVGAISGMIAWQWQMKKFIP